MPEKSIIEVAREARDLLARPGGWTQNVEARDAEGNATGFLSDDAVCFCASFAICRVAGSRFGAAEKVRERLRGFLGRMYAAPNIVGWNDAPGRTQSEVVAALTAFIREEEFKAEATPAPDFPNQEPYR